MARGGAEKKAGAAAARVLSKGRAKRGREKEASVAWCGVNLLPPTLRARKPVVRWDWSLKHQQPSYTRLFSPNPKPLSPKLYERSRHS